MNERIRELLEEAGIFKPKEFYQHIDALQLEKFAELIVRECMKVAASQRNPANLNYKPSERFVEDLRQHFGVE